MAEARRNTRESAQVYQIARHTISQNGSMKDTIASFLRDYTVNGISKPYSSPVNPLRP